MALVPERQARHKDLPYQGLGAVPDQVDASYPPHIDDTNELDKFIMEKVKELGAATEQHRNI